MAQLAKGAGLDGATGPDDAHRVAERLDLAEDVAGEQDGAPVAADLLDALPEDPLHERVQPGRRLVEEEQLDVRGQRRDEGDLLPVALGVGPALLRRVQLETLEEPGLAGRVEPAAEPPEQVDDLAAGEIGPDRHVAGHVGEPSVQRLDLGPWVAAEQRRGPTVGAEQP